LHSHGAAKGFALTRSENRMFNRHSIAIAALTLAVPLGIFPENLCAQGEDLSSKVSTYERAWPDGRPTLFRLSNNMIFAIPPEYQKFWLQKDQVVRAPADPKDIPTVESIGFQFFMPDYSGYTPQNYMDDFNDNLVNVERIEPSDPAQMQPDAPGYYPPNMLKRSMAILAADKGEDRFGLRCYPPRESPVPPRELTCYGQRGAKGEYIMLDTYVAPFTPGTYPTMQARYFSPHFGGVVIVWRTSAKNFPHWDEIDTQIWKFVTAWATASNAIGQWPVTK
jgi:hypothetical protein